MSITVRQWSPEELAAVRVGKDKWLTTVFMNVKTFNLSEITHYPYNLRRTYLCRWNKKPLTANEVKIYATDERMLLRFIDEEYIRRPDEIHQVVTQYRPVKV